MKTRIDSISICVLFIFFSQAKTMFGQTAPSYTNNDTLSLFKTKINSHKNEQKKIFSFFKRKRKIEDTSQKDTLLTQKDSISEKNTEKKTITLKDRFIFPESRDSSFNPVVDSLKKIENTILGTKLNQSFDLKQGSINPVRDSLINKNSANYLKNKYKQVIPGMGTNQNLCGKKENILTKKDSLIAQNKMKLKSFEPKVFIKKQLQGIKPHGTISAGYDYGVLPFVAGNNYPSGGFRTEGQISFLVLNIPLELTYYYTNIKNTIGLTNYFRVSYDASRYKDQLEDKLNVKNKLKTEQFEKLQLEQQGIMKNIEYLDFLNQNPNYKFPVNDSLKNKYVSNYNKYIPKDSLYDFSNPSIKHTAVDTSKILNQYLKTDSLKNNNEYLRKKDSISNELNTYKAEYVKITTEINKVKTEIDQIKNIQKNPTSYTNPYFSKVQNVLSGLQKFEIGLCHPTYSTFLVDNIPLQGINVEYAKNTNFLAFTYGTTINNLLFNPNTIQGTMQGARNLYNYFDFGNLSSGRKVLSLKGGVGAKEDSHIYVGFLLGKGRSDYLLNDNSSTSYTKESNVVLELDAKYKFSDKLNVDVALGKSSVKEEDMSMEQIKKSVNEILSNYRSYAFLARVNTSIKKTKTKLTFTTRWLDPYFKSFGIGFIRSDNFRYEIKAEQQITSKIKYTIAYRKEEDNLLKLYNYKNTLQSINNTLNLKLNRQLNIRLIYTPLFRELKTPSMIIKDRNTISTVILSYTPRPRKVISQFNLLYSKYIISGDSSNINFENFTYTHQFIFKKGLKTDLNVSWFRNNLKDTLGNDTYLAVLGIGYVAQNKNSVTIGGKMAYKNKIAPQYGFVAKVNVKLYKGLLWEAQVEKIIIGDYYNSFMVEKIKQFPYYCSTRLVLNF